MVECVLHSRIFAFPVNTAFLCNVVPIQDII